LLHVDTQVAMLVTQRFAGTNRQRELPCVSFEECNGRNRYEIY